MTTIDPQAPSIRDIFNRAANAGKVEPKKAELSSRSVQDPASRSVQDTVTLSDGGHEIVNLARGFELAKEFKSAPVDENYAQNLKQASADISRVSTLFSEVMKSAFAKWR